jgi:small-conductance mechanosensitive channel
MADMLTTFFLNLKQIGFYDFLLPWLFTFAIVYGLLMKVKLFGEEVNKKVSVALAFVIAFFVTAFAGPGLAAFFSGLFGGASIFLAGILVIVLFLAMIGWTPDMGKGGRSWKIAALILIIIGVAIFLVSSGIVINGGFVLNDITVTGIIVIVIIVAAMYFIAYEGKKEEKGASAGGGGKPPGQ